MLKLTIYRLSHHQNKYLKKFWILKLRNNAVIASNKILRNDVHTKKQAQEVGTTLAKQ